MWRVIFSALLIVPAYALAQVESNIEIRASGHAISIVDTGRRVREKLPPTLFGFNVQHYNFERDLWRIDKNATDSRVTTSLGFFPGAMYRYPGGLVANRFSWQAATGPSDTRVAQRAVEGAAAAPVRFGVEEFLAFVRDVDGQPVYVLNLVGWDERGMMAELPLDTIQRDNAELAKFMKARLAGSGLPRIYELGNELDRSEYQWPHQKYIERSRGTIEAIRSVDPDARFIAFLREFDWRYRGDERAGTVSRAADFIADVLGALPEVDGFSMHFYYDDPGVEKNVKQLPWRLNLFHKAIDVARKSRGGVAPDVWITEHARGVNLEAGKAVARAAVTSNLSATISTADFLIALSQIPEVRGAAWHALNGRAWQLFDATIEHNDLRARPVYWGLRVLRALDLPVVLDTQTASPKIGNYAGGYDVRTVGFSTEGGDEVGLWAINRSRLPTDLTLEIATWKNRPVNVRHYYLCGERNVDADDPSVATEIELEPDYMPARFSESGSLTLRLPSSSVSSFRIAARAGEDQAAAAGAGQDAC